MNIFVEFCIRICVRNSVRHLVFSKYEDLQVIQDLNILCRNPAKRNKINKTVGVAEMKSVKTIEIRTMRATGKTPLMPANRSVILR